MESQSTGLQETSVDPWERIRDDSVDVDGSPCLSDSDHSPSPVDIRFSRPKVTWINPQDVQPPLQDLRPPVATTGKSGSHFVADAASSLGPSPSSLENSPTETPLLEDALQHPLGGCFACGSCEKSRDLSLSSTKERAVLPGSSLQGSVFTNSEILATSPCPEADGAFIAPFHPTASTDDGAVQVNRRTISLNSFLPEAFLFPIDVEKENAHFYVADMMISAMEKMKCNILSQQQAENWSVDKVSGSLGNDPADPEVTFYASVKQESVSSTRSDSGYEVCAGLKVSPVVETPTDYDLVKESSKCDFDEFVILELEELNDITETCGCSCSSSKSGICEPDFNSAELIAKELYQVFEKCWLLSEVNYQPVSSLNAAGSIVVNEEHVRKQFESGVDVVQEIKFKSRIRGTDDWAPPRFQIIFNVHPPPKRDLVVAAQNFFCAGCGTPVQPKFLKRLRYCEYLGKYFCDCCHSYAESCIPARILMMWDFRRYYVSNFSKRLLDSIWHQPIFNLLTISQSLYSKAKELDRVREMQEQLFHIKKLLRTCRFARSTLKEFEQVPRHLTEEHHLFSLDDLVRIKRRLLAPLLKELLKASLTHVANCELCQGRGFICEFCRSTAVIFPFQTETCRRCSVCRACFHKQCFQSSECPRCARISARRRHVQSLPSPET
ncbi:protein associated with UVRAG as autophagy enhancer isoform X1 [Trichechus manatus latirostris]|uniref:Protein associated with UVRAG as autophagy enhancer isoform X1 n=1 Tax=Trichechus manatus latirostris TaxID=127582 RepID=A0A2Y9QVI5_TRIMA|nr:protein associated with UVRAG as autophagy enhancer isoform X1 [Trichechus manatus latirostris]XP_023587354.1 protein associated with UVRAG as autophagy enhancer isoform X1 [Trichechus manatus latirostris]XP_023587355.1 protein associated with UVRAG as autophagy enhancer isoform X1 [Trichechus manatus latirostris]XP_023587356.1 protein associated with UVRAG as autophagy enhancer isoform X1 [Trichechus manatus latirostris]